MPELAEQRRRIEREFDSRLTAAIDRHAPEIVRGLKDNAPSVVQDTANDLWQPFARTIGDQSYWPLVLAYLTSYDNLDGELGRPLPDGDSRSEFSAAGSRSGRGDLILPSASISVQQAADAYASQRSDDLAESIVVNTAARLDYARHRFDSLTRGTLPRVPLASRPSLTLPPVGAPGAPTPGDRPLDWDREFADALSPARVERIAISETTDTISAGESGLVGRIRVELGWIVKAVWHTEKDGRVCPICREFDETDEDYFLPRIGYPKAHPQCRCWLTWKVIKKPEPVTV